MSLLLVAPDREMESLKEALLKLDSNLDIEIWPNIKNNERVQFAVSWNHPEGIFSNFPNLKAVSSLGAGADHLLNDPELPEEITIARIVSPSLIRQMKEFTAGAVFNYQRNIYTYIHQKREGIWKTYPNIPPGELPVGIMGLGTLGQPVARFIAAQGYPVRGWSTSPKNIDAVDSYTGDDELDAFLGNSRVLVCLLPLTSQTKGIINIEVFKKMKHPGFMINVARGEHLIDEDLIYAIDKGWIDRALLDVFTEEPLPEKHPFWNRSEILITPHIASVTPPGEAAKQIIDNYKRTLSGLSLNHTVDRDKGY